MNEVDDAIIAAVEAEGVRMLNAHVPTDQVSDDYEDGDPNEPRVITVELPYTVLYSNLGDDNQPRLGGRTSQRSIFFQVTSVGGSPEQTKWAAARQRRALKDRRLAVTDPETDTPYRLGRISVDESQRMRRDDNTTDPNGNPIFYLVDTYSVKLSNKR